MIVSLLKSHFFCSFAFCLALSFLPVTIDVGKAFALPAEMVSGAPVSFADLAEKLSPAVVNISTTKTIKGRSGSPFGGDTPFQRFFGQDDLQLSCLRCAVNSSQGFQGCHSSLCTRSHCIDCLLCHPMPTSNCCNTKLPAFRFLDPKVSRP